MNTKVLYTFISASFLILIFQVAFSAPPVSFYNPWETNDPSCAPNDINCDVSLDSLDTDDQTLSLSGSNLSIQDGNTITLPSVTDTDDQILSLSGSILSIQDGNNVDLAAFDSDTIYTANGIVGSNRTVWVTDTLNFDSNTFVIDGADNRVGIGTSNPLSQLDITSSSPTTEDALTVTTNVNNADILMRAQWSIAAESNMYINIDSDDNATSNALFIGHNAKGVGAAALMTVLESGNVGIGTANPATKLDVQGTVNVNSTGVDFTVWDNRALRTGATWTKYNFDVGSAIFRDGNGSVNNGYVYSDGLVVWAWLTFRSSTPPTRWALFEWNVGIGTVTPGSKLSVVGLPSGTTDAVVSGSLAGAVCITTSGNMYIDTNGTCSN